MTNKTDPQMKDLLENPLKKESSTVIEYQGMSQSLDEYIIQYAKDCGLEFIGTGYMLDTGTRDIQFAGDFEIPAEICLEALLADKGIKVTITTDEG